MERSIIWKKWHDPLQPLVNGKIIPSYEPEEDEEDPDFHRAIQSFGDDDEPNPYHHGRRRGYLGPTVMTPIGMVPLNETNLPGQLYNFWLGYTNFRLTRPIVQAIKSVLGVEAMNIFTPYRFRIAIGKYQFKQQEVMDAIVAAVQPTSTPKPAESLSKLDKLKNRLTKAFPFWAICFLHGGTTKCVGAKTQEDLQTMLKQYEGKTEKVILSWAPEGQ